MKAGRYGPGFDCCLYIGRLVLTHARHMQQSTRVDEAQQGTHGGYNNTTSVYRHPVDMVLSGYMLSVWCQIGEQADRGPRRGAERGGWWLDVGLAGELNKLTYNSKLQSGHLAGQAPNLHPAGFTK